MSQKIGGSATALRHAVSSGCPSSHTNMNALPRAACSRQRSVTQWIWLTKF